MVDNSSSDLIDVIVTDIVVVIDEDDELPFGRRDESVSFESYRFSAVILVNHHFDVWFGALRALSNLKFQFIQELFKHPCSGRQRRD